jgi:SAM-dependent methyltransferase
MPSDYVCPNCGAIGLSIFYEAKNVPVNSCILLSTEEQAIDFPRSDVALGFCEACGFITNTAFDPSKVDYSSVYEDQQCFSSTFNAFAQDLAKRLVGKYNLHNKRILEIGCGKGDFLALLCELGTNYGVGIDPAYTKGRVKTEASDRLEFIQDYYSKKYAKYNGDLICCRHTLEHIHNPAEFVGIVRQAIGNRLDTKVFFEVPDVTRVLCELAFWDIYYEHCSYFTLGSLARLFRLCKFEVTDLAIDFDGQYLLIESIPAEQRSYKKHKLEETVKETKRHVRYFSNNCSEKLNQWQRSLKKLHAEKKRVVIWGSGSKCVSFLTTLNIKDEIDCVIDINPHRHGKFIPGAGKKIMPPQFLKKYNPDVTIVMNSAYCNEIQQMLNSMEVITEVLPV